MRRVEKPKWHEIYNKRKSKAKKRKITFWFIFWSRFKEISIQIWNHSTSSLTPYTKDIRNKQKTKNDKWERKTNEKGKIKGNEKKRKMKIIRKNAISKKPKATEKSKVHQPCHNQSCHHSSRRSKVSEWREWVKWSEVKWVKWVNPKRSLDFNET